MAMRVLEINSSVSPQNAVLYGVHDAVHKVLRMRSEDPSCKQLPEPGWQSPEGYMLRLLFRGTCSDMQVFEIEARLHDKQHDWWTLLWSADATDCSGIYQDRATGEGLYYLSDEEAAEIATILENHNAVLRERRRDNIWLMASAAGVVSLTGSAW